MSKLKRTLTALAAAYRAFMAALRPKPAEQKARASGGGGGVQEPY